MDFRTTALLLWGVLAFIQIAPALYIFRKKKHLFLGVSLLGMFSLLTWQRILWVFWSDYSLDQRGWLLATASLIFCTGLILISYFSLQSLSSTTRRNSLSSEVSEAPPWSFFLLILSLVLEVSPFFRETIGYLPYVCVQTLCLASFFLQPNYGIFLISCVTASVLLSFLSTGSLSLGVRVFEIALLVGLVKRQIKYWVVLVVFVGGMSCLQTVKSIYRGEIAREMASETVFPWDAFVKSVMKSPFWLSGGHDPKSLSVNKMDTYYGYGVEKINPYFADKSVLPWDSSEWNELYSTLLASRAAKGFSGNRFYEGYIRRRLGIEPEPRLSLLTTSLANEVSEKFGHWESNHFLYPVFQFSSSLYLSEGEKYFPQTALFDFDVFPVQVWNNRVFHFTRGFLRLGDDTLDKVLLLSPRVLPFWKGKTYAFNYSPKRAREIANDFGRQYGYLSFWDDKTTVNFNQFSEAYINFGFVGLALSALFFGCVLYVLEAALVGLSLGIRELGFVCMGKVIFFPKETTALVSALFMTFILIGFMEYTKRNSSFTLQKRKARRRHSFPL